MRRIWRAPAVQALLIQCAALPFFLLVGLMLASIHLQLTGVAAALTQGVLALIISYLRRLAPWWLPIQLLFPLAVLGATSLHLPSWLFLAAFLLLVLVYWSTFRTQVPYFPSGQRAWDEVAKLLPRDRPVHLIDIGSGLGGLVLDLAKRRPDSTFSGIELAPLPWLASRLRALGHPNAHFVRGDYERLDFAGFDVVFAYLSPAAMEALWRKASAEMRPGALLLSYEFGIEATSPDITIAPTGPGPLLYGWRF